MVEVVVDDRTDTWTTPGRGLNAVFDYRFRPETTDWNTVSSILTADEYGLAGMHLTGWAIDVGAHIGGMTIGLALNNPDLRVIAIEPVPGNVELLRRNVERNGLNDRVVVIDGAAGTDGECVIAWNWDDGAGSSLTGHRFIGGSSLAQGNPDIPHSETTVRSWSLAGLLKEYDIDDLALLKIDAEGAEAVFLKTPALAKVARIVGEWHPPYIKDRAHLLKLLSKTHAVTFSGAEGGPSGFDAVRR
jgi:FkbM family methyltransferase